MPITMHLFVSTCILKSPTIRTLSAARTNSDAANHFVCKANHKVCMVAWSPVHSSQYKSQTWFVIYSRYCYIKHQHFERIIFETSNSENITI